MITLYRPISILINCYNKSTPVIKVVFSALSILFFAQTIAAEEKNAERYVTVIQNQNTNLYLQGKAKTLVVGSPDIAKVVILKPDLLLVTGTAIGVTTLTVFGRNGEAEHYRIQVTHDLFLLRQHLSKIDPRIEVNSDTNSDAIVLTGIAATTDLIERAEEAAIKFFGTYQNTLDFQVPAKEQSESLNPSGQPADKLPSVAKTPGPYANAISQKGTIKSRTRIINLILNERQLLSAPLRLKGVLSQIDPRIEVEEVNGVFLLKGKVKTASDLSKVLSMADRFVNGNTKPETDFTVISDYGGVLAGNIDEDNQVNPVLPSATNRGAGGIGGRGGLGAGVGTGGVGAGGVGAGGVGAGGVGGRGGVNNQTVLPLTLGNGKGNLAQNIARANVVTVADGKVMSLIQVDNKPRVEIQMRIVGVDRTRTEDLGIDWRLIGLSTSSGKSTAVSIGSLLGNVTDTLPGITDDASGTINPGTSTLVLGATRTTASRILSLSSFIRWVETKGAAKTLTEPLMTALSGESATFSVGGTLPVLTQDQTTFANNGVTQNTTTNITFLQYGLGIVVRPTVLENGKISIVLDQTLSEPDYTVAVSSLDADVPGFKTRTVNTITESSDGETWAVAGLLNEEDTQTTKAVPFLSNIPVLGWLFRNENQGRSRKELLLVITARLMPDADIGLSSTDSTSEINTDPATIDKMLSKNKSPSSSRPIVPINQDNKTFLNQSTYRRYKTTPAETVR